MILGLWFTIRHPVQGQRIRSNQEVCGYGHSEEPDERQPNRGAAHLLIINQLLNERREKNATHGKTRRCCGDGRCTLHMEPACDNGGRGSQTTGRPRNGKHCIHNKEVPLLRDMAHHVQRPCTDNCAAIHEVAHIELHDQTCNNHIPQTTNEEEESGGDREGRNVPAELFRERIEVHTHAVKAQRRAKEENCEATSNNPPAGKCSLTSQIHTIRSCRHGSPLP